MAGGKERIIKVKVSEGFGPWDPKKLLLQLNDFQKNQPVKKVEGNGTELLVILNEYSAASVVVTGWIAKQNGLNILS